MTDISKNAQRESYLRREKLKRKKHDLEDRLSFGWILSDEEKLSLQKELGRVDEELKRQESLSRQVL